MLTVEEAEAMKEAIVKEAIEEVVEDTTVIPSKETAMIVEVAVATQEADEEVVTEATSE